MGYGWFLTKAGVAKLSGRATGGGLRRLGTGTQMLRASGQGGGFLEG